MTYKFYDGVSGSSIELRGNEDTKELVISTEECGTLPDFITIELDASEIGNMITALKAIKKELDERV